MAALKMVNLRSSQHLGYISLLCNKLDVPQFLMNWRPISLLDVDYKIVSKSLSNQPQDGHVFLGLH